MQERQRLFDIIKASIWGGVMPQISSDIRESSGRRLLMDLPKVET